MRAARWLPLLVPAWVLLAGLSREQAAAQQRRVEVPEVVGQEVERAERLLLAAGLRVRLVGPQEGEGRRLVTVQHPAGGARVREGVTVRLVYRWVEAGDVGPGDPRRRTVRVPHVLGLAPQAAERRLQDAGLGARILAPTFPPDQIPPALYVVTQHPRGGATVRRGATVRLVCRPAR